MLHRPILCALAAGAILATAAPTSAAPFQVEDFGESAGENPGDLEMWAVAPSSAGPGAPLVVVLHGCNQDVSDHQYSGFEALAEEHGFYLLYPRQKITNNVTRCFNWFGESGDDDNLVRGQGENQSIAQMVERMGQDFGVDLDRVYAVGLSAGGAMTAILLATWPDVFAGGMIVAGVPYRCATSALGGLHCMNLDSYPSYRRSPKEWGDLVRDAAPANYAGRWPRVLVVTGEDDATVDPIASAELVEQWTNVHGIELAPESSTVGGHLRQRYEKGGDVAVEAWQVAHMGHAFPVDPDLGCGEEATYYDDRDLCGAQLALDFFGLATHGGPQPDAGASGPDGGPRGDGGNGDGDGDGDADAAAAEDPRGSGGGCAVVASGAPSGAGTNELLLSSLALMFSVLARGSSARRRKQS